MKNKTKYQKIWNGDEWVEVPMTKIEEFGEAMDNLKSAIMISISKFIENCEYLFKNR